MKSKTVSTTEHAIQVELISWFRKTFPGIRIIAIPNGGWRSVVTASRLKSEGVVPGVPDLYVPAWNLWIELKTEKGRLTGAQADWIDYLNSIGHKAFVARGLEEAKDIISRTATSA